MSPSSSGLKQVDLLHAVFLLGLFFNYEDGGDMSFQNAV
jgi:hypothetical protein